MELIHCNGCGNAHLTNFLDLGNSPISNDYQGVSGQTCLIYPLKVLVCNQCKLMQLSQVIPRETHFNAQYPYFSGYSTTWISHCKKTSKTLVERFQVGEDSLVIEIASNDGTLIQFFKAVGSRVLGIEPSANVARSAQLIGIPTVIEFFGLSLAQKLISDGMVPDLVLGFNVLAHVPDINDFVAGISVLLGENGVGIFEFPHGAELIKNFEFDTIYHEHYSYLNLIPLITLFEKHDLKIFDVESHELHGGSLRIFATSKYSTREIEESVSKILTYERQWDPTDQDTKMALEAKVFKLLQQFKEKLLHYKEQNYKVAIFGAAAKATTFLNAANTGSDLIDFAVDSSVAKQGLYIPGTNILIRKPEDLYDEKPEIIIICAWNFASEIMAQANQITGTNNTFLIAFPELRECKSF